jgi:hypothetical protein
MKEHFYWGDTDGNNGYSYYELTPAEIQAAFELEGLPYISWGEESGERRGRLEIRFDENSQPYIAQFPNEIDALTIKAAVEARAKLIEEKGKLNIPTNEEIRAKHKKRFDKDRENWKNREIVMGIEKKLNKK